MIFEVKLGVMPIEMILSSFQVVVVFTWVKENSFNITDSTVKYLKDYNSTTNLRSDSFVFAREWFTKWNEIEPEVTGYLTTW